MVEHPFGTIKRTLGFGHFLQRGLEAVGASLRFSCLIYDLKRVLNLVPLGKLMEAVGRSGEPKKGENRERSMCRDFSLINRPPPAAMAAWSRQFASGLVRLFTQSERRWLWNPGL